MNPIVRAFLASLPLWAVACSQTPPTALAVDEAALSSSDTPHQPSPCAITYEDDAIIRGSVDRIWDTLVDLPRYSEWNPWVVSAEGKIEPGAAVTVQVVLGSHTQKAEHVVLTVSPKSDFCWRDAGWNSWFVYAQRCRWLTPRADGTVAYHVELLLDGPIDWLADWTNGKALRDGLSAETAALKARVEIP
jgi:hypothetical protein